MRSWRRLHSNHSVHSVGEVGTRFRQMGSTLILSNFFPTWPESGLKLSDRVFFTPSILDSSLTTCLEYSEVLHLNSTANDPRKWSPDLKWSSSVCKWFPLLSGEENQNGLDSSYWITVSHLLSQQKVLIKLNTFNKYLPRLKKETVKLILDKKFLKSYLSNTSYQL